MQRRKARLVELINLNAPELLIVIEAEMYLDSFKSDYPRTWLRIWRNSRFAAWWWTFSDEL